MNESLRDENERVPRVGDRVSIGGREGVLRYLYGTEAAVVRFDGDRSTKVVSLRRLAAADESPQRDR